MMMDINLFSSYLGMEHQSAVTYGNGFMYNGVEVKAGLYGVIDPLIIHETGHEWFGNSVTASIQLIYGYMKVYRCIQNLYILKINLKVMK